MYTDHLFDRSLSRTSNLTLVRPSFKLGMSISNMTLNGLVNAINLEEMYRESMKMDGDQLVTGNLLSNTTL